MERVRKINHKGKEILVVDYSDQRGDSMIESFEKAKSLALGENKQIVVLSILNNKTFVNSNFMKHIRQRLPEVESLIDKQAVIGLSAIQEWILKGMNLWYGRKVHNFDSLDEALDFLVMDASKVKV